MKDRILDTILTGSTGFILIDWTANLPVETVYQLFVQSLVATATIGKLLHDVLKARNSYRDKKNPPEDSEG